MVVIRRNPKSMRKNNPFFILKKMFPDKIIKGKRPIGRLRMNFDMCPKYLPIEREKPYSQISLTRYEDSKGGVIIRRCVETKLLGYCTTSPKEVLEKLFGNYYIASYKERNLFESYDMPDLGLKITGMNKLYGIGGKLREMKRLRNFDLARRKEAVSNKEIEAIVKHVNEPGHLGWLSPDHERIQCYAKEVSSIVRKYKK